MSKSQESSYGQFKSDANLEKDGIWVNYGPFRVLVARAGGSNTRYMKAADRKSRELRRQGKMNMIALQDMQKELVAETCIVGWEVKRDGKYVPGIEHPETKEVVAYNVANVKEVFEALPNLALALVGEASEQDNYSLEEAEDEAKNSSTS